MSYQVFNHFDEKQRFRGVTYYIADTPGQVDSHGYSYMYAREQLQELGEQMGIQEGDLEKRVHEVDEK